MKWTWLGAICLSLAGAVVLWIEAANGTADWTYRRTIPFADIAFIGSSLFHDAIPESSPPQGLLGDGRRHLRVWGNSIGEATATNLLNQAIDAGIPAIFIEVYPFTRDFASDPPRSKSLAAVDIGKFEQALRYLALRLRAGAKVILNALLARRADDETAQLSQDFDGNLTNYRQYYPLRLVAPVDPAAIHEAVRRAQARNIRLTMVALPSSQSLVNYLGPDRMRALDEHVAAFARSFDVTLWSPADAWPDDYFIDPAHLNLRGRARFADELRAAFGTAK